MAITVCTCSSNPGNTGTPRCEVQFKAQAGMILVPMKGNDGTANQIDLTATLDQTFFDALTQNTDPSKRWYPIHNTKNAESERAESIKFEYEDGSSYKVQDGVRPFSLILPLSGTVFLSKLEQWECRDFGFYQYDIEGNLRGELSADGAYLNPIQIASGTWDAIAAFASSTTITENRVNFQFGRNVKDSRLRLIQPVEMSDIEMSGLTGLFDVNGVFTGISTTTVTAELTDDYGTAITKNAITGLLAADFTVRNVATDATYAVSAAPEAPTGTYAIVFAIAPSGTYQLEVPPSKGYEVIVDPTFVIP
jgi:hypothetical protein